MATRYRIQIGDEIIEFEGPDDLSDAQISKLGDEYLKTAKPGQEFPESVYVGDVVDPSLAEQPMDSSVGGSYARGVTQGGTANFADEISSFMNAAVPGLAALDDFTGLAGNDQQAFYDNPEGFWAAVRHNMGDFAAQKRADAEQHATAQTLGEVSGAIGTLPIGGAVSKVVPEAAAAYMAANPIKTAAALGAGGGAVSGAGAGTEGNRAQSAALGGLTGLALGTTIAGGMELAPAVAQYAKIFFGRGSDKEAVAQITKALQRDGFDVTSPSGVQKLKATLQEFTGKPVSLADIGGATRSRTGVGLRTPSNAQQVAVDQLRERTAGQGQRLASDIRSNVAPRTDVHNIDEALVNQRSQEAERLRELALYEDGPAPQRLNVREVDEADSRGIREFAIQHPTQGDTGGSIILHPDGRAEVDIYGPGGGTLGVAETRRMMQDLKDQIPEIKYVTGERTSGARADLPQGYSGKIQKINVENLPAARPEASGRQSRIIDPSRETDPTRYQTAVELQNLARLPDAQKALTAALEVSDAEVRRLAATGQDFSHLPDLDRGSNLDVRTFDVLKRYLDDEINRIYKRGEGNSFKMADVANVRALRDDIRDRLKSFVPEYEDYLNQYAGSTEMINALREGADFTKLSPEQIGAAQSRRSVAGQELYRTGAARSLLDDVMETRDNAFPASRILNSPEARAQLEALGVDPANAAALNKSVQQERVLNLLPQELGGAQTAQRAISQADANAGIDMTVPFNPGSPVGWAGMVARGIRDRVSLARNEAVNNELLPRMMETDPRIIGGIIDELERNGQAQMAAQLRRRQLQARSGYLSGAVIGAPVAIGE